jgi:hypothetical protein
MEEMKGRPAAPRLTAILYVVVNEQRVVQDLDCDGGSEGILEPRSK